MAIAMRAAIAALPGYAPPKQDRQGLRLDFNENTSGCAPAVLRALAAAKPSDLAGYPDVTGAEAAITAAFGHSPASALLTNGIDDALLLLALTLLEPGDEAIVPEPAFAMYRFYIAQMGARAVAAPWRERAAGVPAAARASEFYTDIEAIAAAVTPRTRAVFLASPNNPTGHLTPLPDVLALARRFPDLPICLDEAYAEFVSDGYQGALAEVLRFPNLVVMRTFSKAYGLAGARLGCLFAHPDWLPTLRKAHSPYNVSRLAALCGVAALADREWTSAYLRAVLAGRDYLEATLAGLGIPYWRSAANFILFDAGPAAADLLRGMRARGVLLRDRGADRTNAVRMTCGTEAQMNFACSALRDVWGKTQARRLP